MPTTYLNLVHLNFYSKTCLNPDLFEWLIDLYIFDIYIILNKAITLCNTFNCFQSFQFIYLYLKEDIFYDIFSFKSILVEI